MANNKVETFRQGDTKVIKVDYGNTVDITGFIHMFTMKTDFDANSPIIAQVISTVGDHADDLPNNGVAWVELDSTTSFGIPVGVYIYDVQRVIPDGANPPKVLTLSPPSADFAEPVQVLPQATRVTS